MSSVLTNENKDQYRNRKIIFGEKVSLNQFEDGVQGRRVAGKPFVLAGVLVLAPASSFESCVVSTDTTMCVCV